MRRRGWALLLLLAGCARSTPPPVTPVRETPPQMPASFHCRGRPRLRFPLPPSAPPVAPGRLVIRRLPLPLAPPPSAEEAERSVPFGRVRLQVVAVNAPLPRFAAALAEALHVDVAVAPDAFDEQVTLASPDVTAGDVIRALRASEVTSEVDERRWLRLDARSAGIAAYEARRDEEAAREFLPTHLFAPLPWVPPAQVAQYFCDQLASERGSAHVVAGRLIVRDVDDRFQRFQGFLDSVERRIAARPASPPAPAPALPAPVDFRCRGPEQPPLPVRVPRPPVPSGRLIVQRLPLPVGTPEPRGEGDPPPPPLAGVRLRVIAEAVNLGPFAAALSEALHVSVVVPSDSQDVQVSLASSDITVDRLLRSLSLTGARGLAEGGVFRLDALPPPGAEVLRVHQSVMIEPVEARLLPPTPGVPFDQVAAYFCSELASHRGMAHVVAGWLLVDDTASSLNQVEQLVRALTPDATPSGDRTATPRAVIAPRSTGGTAP